MRQPSLLLILAVGQLVAPLDAISLPHRRPPRAEWLSRANKVLSSLTKSENLDDNILALRNFDSCKLKSEQRSTIDILQALRGVTPNGQYNSPSRCVDRKSELDLLDHVLDQQISHEERQAARNSGSRLIRFHRELSEKMLTECKALVARHLEEPMVPKVGGKLSELLQLDTCLRDDFACTWRNHQAQVFGLPSSDRRITLAVLKKLHADENEGSKLTEAQLGDGPQMGREFERLIGKPCKSFLQSSPGQTVLSVLETVRVFSMGHRILFTDLNLDSIEKLRLGAICLDATKKAHGKFFEHFLVAKGA